MDAIFIIICALVFCLSKNKGPARIDDSGISYEVLEREVKLNEDFYDDANAFRRIINELGF